MKNKLRLLLVFILGIFCVITALADNNSPIGTWKTIDDATGKQKSIIRIFSTADNTLSGQVIKIYPKPGKDENEICDACTGAKHNQRIAGMIVLEGMKQENSDKWSGGKILDPNNGKTYRCTLTIINNGANMRVRGYIGLPLFGRSQIWIRMK